jgi:hypothetical protein
MIGRALVVGLPQIAARARRRELLIETIDGEPAARSARSATLIAAGARVDYRGLVVARSALAEPRHDDGDADAEDSDDEAT